MICQFETLIITTLCAFIGYELGVRISKKKIEKRNKKALADFRQKQLFGEAADLSGTKHQIGS